MKDVIIKTAITLLIASVIGGIIMLSLGGPEIVGILMIALPVFIGIATSDDDSDFDDYGY